MSDGAHVMHLDMDAFFASVEQAVNPELRGRAIAVTGAAKRTVVTTASYEARAFGVRTGMNRFEAKRKCPHILFISGDNRKYMDVSRRIMNIIKSFSPLVEVYSVDEAFIDISGLGGLLGGPLEIGRSMKHRIKAETNLICSVGIAPNKLMAKLASNFDKPDGLTLIRACDVEGHIRDLPVGKLWGIGPNISARLAVMGIKTCAELGRAPAGVLRTKFGIIGERLGAMGRGQYEDPVSPAGADDCVKSIGHSMTLPEDVSEKDAIRMYLLKLSEMVCARARRHGLRGRTLCLTLRYPDFYTFTRQRRMSRATNDTHTLYRAAKRLISSMRLKAPLRLIGVSLKDIVEGARQLPLFTDEVRRERLLMAMDEINGRFGRTALTWSALLERERAPGVISPAWRPTGVRNIDTG